MTLKLYELTGAYLQLMDEDEKAFTTALEQLEGNIVEKAEGVAMVVRSMEAEEAALRAEANHLAERARAAGNRADRLKGYLLLHLESVHMEQIKGRLLTIAIQDSPPRTNILDVESLPEECRKLIPANWSPIVANIVALWKREGSVPGAEITVGRHIRIR